jgi:hypothetical protein
MDWVALADGLVQRIAPALPAGISMRVELTGITIAKPSVPHAWCHISADEELNQADDGVATVETVAYSLLSSVQDFVAEFSERPWPSDAGGLPLPKVRYAEGVLHCCTPRVAMS